MKRLLGAMVLLLAGTMSARAHFVFILPVEGSRKAQVVFSDTPKPDRGELLKKIAHAKFTVREGDKDVEVKATTGKDVLDLEAPGEGPAWVVGVCPYGVSARGKEPFLLNYYAKTIFSNGKHPSDALLGKTFPAMKLDLALVVKAEGDRPAVKVLWQGKPLAEANVVLYVPGKDEPVEKKSNKDGLVMLESATKEALIKGVYGIRAAHITNEKGKLGDKSYSAVRSYATLTFPGSAPFHFQSVIATNITTFAPVENPEATKLLADALAARATYTDFPGLHADVKVNVEGKTHKGTVQVSAEGKVTLKMEGDQAWAREALASLIAHRMAGPTQTNQCAFPDETTDHPLGRAITVLNDKFHSSYRIRDKQVIEVNRQMGNVRFTITVMKNHVNEEKKFLPSNYVVNYWDVKTGALKKSVTHYNTWTRVGKYDLPLKAMTVTAEDGKQTARSIKLSGYTLNK